MLLSIVLVSYNGKEYLQNSLASLCKAISAIEAEVIVVDNNSSPAVPQMILAMYPSVNLIRNDSNYGFARACNQGWNASLGQYVLFLNPDVLIPEDSIHQCLAFMERNADCGALGVQMIGADGHFHPESKRGHPDILPYILKSAGLPPFFSKWTGGYYFNSAEVDEVAPVPVLSGAFMLLSRQVLEKSGGFDERYFMYGEDIDLSCTVRNLGYKTVYFGKVAVVHFKGITTPASEWYIRHFYNAMKLFVDKYYKGSWKRIMLKTGISARERIALRNFHRNPAKPSGPDTTYSLLGDPESCREAMAIQPLAKLISREEAPPAGTECILCTGPSFSIKEAISYMKKHAGSQFHFHIKGTGNIIGNPHK